MLYALGIVLSVTFFYYTLLRSLHKKHVLLYHEMAARFLVFLLPQGAMRLEFEAVPWGRSGDLCAHRRAATPLSPEGDRMRPGAK